MKKIGTRGESPFKIKKATMKTDSGAAAPGGSCSPGDGTDKPPC